MDFWSRFFNRPPDKDSADVARQRLHLVLAQDRTHISPETLNVLKDEIITVISQHIEIDRAKVQVSMTHTNQGEQLIANIPVLSAREQVGSTERAKRARRPRPRPVRA